MATIRFVYRTDGAPQYRTIFQERRPGFLRSGSIPIDDGRIFDSNGNLIALHGLVRPLMFTNPNQAWGAEVPPGTDGLLPFQSKFVRGSISIHGAVHDVVRLTYSQTHQFLDGSVTIIDSAANGSVTDFAIWALTQYTDPQDAYVQTATDLNSGGVTQAWSKNSVIFVPHRETKYLSVGARVYGMPNTGTYRNQYFKKWMLEKAYLGGTYPSSPYEQARSVRVTVRPDRLNYFTNPGFEVNTNDLNAGAGTPTLAQSTVQAQSGTHSLLLTSTVAGTDISVVWNSVPKMPKGWWTASWYVWSPVLRTCYATMTQNGVTTTGPSTRIAPNQWQRVSWTFSTDILLPFSLEFHNVADTSQAIGSTIYLDSVLVEHTKYLNDYFDGATSADTMWETGGLAGQTRSYLYKNKADRTLAIRRVLEQNVPFGIGIEDPVLGVLPIDSGYDPSVYSAAYGSGTFGSGNYGG